MESFMLWSVHTFRHVEYLSGSDFGLGFSNQKIRTSLYLDLHRGDYDVF